MRPKENIEEFIKAGKPYVTTSEEMDKRTLEDSLSTMEQAMQAKTTSSTIRLVIKLTAAAAVIILGISILVHQGPGEQNDTTLVFQAADSPAEIMTMKSLKIAFRHGGVKAVENQCDKALKILGPKPASISMADLFNGSRS
jgi:hypothetical protein